MIPLPQKSNHLLSGADRVCLFWLCEVKRSTY